MNSPLVSICIPVKNDAKYVGAAISSALGQDYGSVEVLVSDNASSDATADVIASFSGVVAFRHEHPISMAANWNSFRGRAEGEWVLFLCSDDILHPDAIRKCIDLTSAGVDVVFFEYQHLVGGVAQPKQRFYASSAVIPASEQHAVFIIGNNFPLTAALVRRDALDAVGWFDESYEFCVDWHMWLKLTSSRRGSFVGYVAESLGLYRLHAGNETGRCVTERKALAEVIRMKQQFLERYETTPERRAEVVSASRRGVWRLAQRYADAMDSIGDSETAAFYRAQRDEWASGVDEHVSKGTAPWPLPPNARPFVHLCASI